MRLVAIALTLLVLSCKPAGSDSVLQSIVGLDHDGSAKALGLLPIHNSAEFIDAGKFGAQFRIKDAERKLEVPLLAFVECEGSSKRSAEQWIHVLEKAALRDFLIVNSRRDLFVKAGNRYDYLPMCRLVTNFLVTYPIIESAFQDLMTLPKELPNNHVEERLAKEQLILAQSFFLAMRGSYDPAGGEELAPMLRKVMYWARSIMERI